VFRTVCGAIGVLALTMIPAPAAAQPDEPVVSMVVTLPDGQAKPLSAADSHVATVTVSGVEYGFEPTIQDSHPWNHVVVSVFKMPTARESIVALGEVDLKTGSSAVTTKTSPAFKIAIDHVAQPGATGRT
jgi:hypothetical protein